MTMIVKYAGSDIYISYPSFSPMMLKAASELNFEAAAEYRDKMIELKEMLQSL